MPGYQTLPSGKLRRQEIINGRRISFTGSTQKEIRQMIDDYKKRLELDSDNTENPTIKIILDNYITSKEKVLSPTTIKAYKKMQLNSYSYIEDRRLSEINSVVLQRFVSKISDIYSPKSVKNIYGLLSSAIHQVTDKTFNVTLPKYIKPKQFTPTDKQIKQLLKSCDGELKIAVMLSAFGTLRRGEICGIKHCDIDRNSNTIFIHSDMVQDSNNVWVYKPYPKTDSSIRYITYPKEVIELLPKGDPDEFLIKSTPNSLSQKMQRKKKSLGFDISMHSLRRYSASFMHAMGIPDKYIMEVGGWSSDYVLKNIYENTLSDKSKEFNQKRNDYVQKKFFKK